MQTYSKVLDNQILRFIIIRDRREIIQAEVLHPVRLEDQWVKVRVDKSGCYRGCLFWMVRPFGRELKANAYKLAVRRVVDGDHRRACGLIGIYERGIQRGTTTAATVKIPMYAHSIGPTPASIGTMVYVASG